MQVVLYLSKAVCYATSSRYISGVISLVLTLGVALDCGGRAVIRYVDISSPNATGVLPDMVLFCIQ